MFFDAQCSAVYSSATARASLLPAGRRWRGGSPEQIGRLDAKTTRKPVDDLDACGINAPFKGANVGTINLRPSSELFLRQALGLPELPQIQREHLSYFHPRDGAALSSFLPRSILYKVRCCEFARVLC